MSSEEILISDANIWIDLDTGGLVKLVFRLPYKWLVPDLIFHELEKPAGSLLRQLGLEQVELNGEQTERVSSFAGANPKISPNDLSALVYAEDNGIILVTGDGDLRQLAVERKVRVHGTLWIIDQLVELTIVKKTFCADALQVMLNRKRRLPLEECEKRIKIWRS